MNLIAPAIDFAHLFAGYLGKLNLALRLHEAGHRVRIVIVDPCDHDVRGVAARHRRATRVSRISSIASRSRMPPIATVELRVHPRDTFIATTWWTAHLAHRAAGDASDGDGSST